jgi:[acyl-carrier-protein] S-malonyltransferase
MGFALLFSGQGLQSPAMLPWLDDDAPAVQSLAAHPGTAPAFAMPGAWRASLADAAFAGRNAFAQPLLTGLALAAWAQLAPHLPAPAAIAGYSVGELPAFAAAGVFDAGTALALAAQRAEAMDRCAAAQPPTGLLGVSGLTAVALDDLCTRFDLAVAIRSGAATAVLGGPRPALADAADSARGAGAHATPLNVALASHTRWMQPAAAGFAQRLADVPMLPPRGALFCGFAGARRVAAADLRHALAAQIDHTVRWSDCMDGIAERGVQRVLEIGAGSALARLWNERHPSIPARAADEVRSAAAVQAWLARADA